MTAGVAGAPAEVLSPTQVRCFMDCQVHWWFKYGLMLPEAKQSIDGRGNHPAPSRNWLA